MQPILPEALLTELRANRQKRDSRSSLDGYRQEIEILAQQGCELGRPGYMAVGTGA
jgi:hypothetical protein